MPAVGSRIRVTRIRVEVKAEAKSGSGVALMLQSRVRVGSVRCSPTTRCLELPSEAPIVVHGIEVVVTWAK